MGVIGNWRWRIGAVLAIAVVICVALTWHRGSPEEKAAKETRLGLRRQGFKTDLADFDLSAPSDAMQFQLALMNFSPGRVTPQSQPPDLMSAAGPDAAIVVWRQDRIPTRSDSISWRLLQESLDTKRAELDAVCDAAISRPIRFNLDARGGAAMLLPHLSPLRTFAVALASRALSELHESHRDAAWTNLLAATRVVSAWEPEPLEISHLVRFGAANSAYNATWQALQWEHWPDWQLARLQQEWESVNFLTNLPATAAFARASAFAMCELERLQPANAGLSLKEALKEMIHSPRYAGATFKEYWRQVAYRSHGVFEDEKALLIFYRDREIELCRAVESSNWMEMRESPAVTNRVRFVSKYGSRAQAMLNLRSISIASQLVGTPFLGRAAEAEARRRLVITALALERYRGRHDAYPASLQALAPEFLNQLPVDFIDGQSLRYHLTEDGHFVLYSPGLDGRDRGGRLMTQQRRQSPFQTPFEFSGAGAFGSPVEADIVWPRPATATQAEARQRQEQEATEARLNDIEELQASHWWERTERRQANVEKILASPPAPTTKAVPYLGRSLNEVLQSDSESNKLTLAELLTLRPVVTGSEPETTTFELPIKYDVLTNIGTLDLFIDPNTNEDSDEGWTVGESECVRASNGNCRLVWRTIYETPGKHALLAGLDLREMSKSDDGCVGPVLPFVVSNFCQFSTTSAQFDPETGALLHAKLVESNSTYTIEFNSPAGERLKTITGNTSNGIIKVRWDLIDEHGHRYQNDSFDTRFHITLTDSGRSQTLKGP